MKKHIFEMLFEFKKRSSAAHTCKSICAIYGKGAVSERTCKKWFKRCRDAEKSVEKCGRAWRGFGNTKVNSI